VRWEREQASALALRGSERAREEEDALGWEEDVPQVEPLGEVLLADPLQGASSISGRSFGAGSNREKRTHAGLVEDEEDRLDDGRWRTAHDLPRSLQGTSQSQQESQVLEDGQRESGKEGRTDFLATSLSVVGGLLTS